jgi:ATP-dependent Clp protease protease subunit
MSKVKLVLSAGIVILVGFSLALKESKPKIEEATSVILDTPAVTVNASENTIGGITFTNPVKAEPVETNKVIKNFKLNIDRTIMLEGVIQNNASEAAIAIVKLNAVSSEPITLLLNSPGGSVIHGARLISAMQASKAKVRTICVSMCASMAFMIHQYGTERLALDRAILMSHPASVGYEGDVDRIMSFIGTIQRYTNKLEAEVAKRMKISFTEYKQKIQNEYWVDAEDALKDNVVDGLVNIQIDASVFETGQFSNKKESVKAKVKEFDIIWIMPGLR